LRGQLLKSDDLAEVRLFAATFLSGAASGLNDRENTVFGNQLAGTLKNAQIAGMQQVLNGYAKQIYETIQREGFYVRVPAGKQFYVYVTQTIDKAKALHGLYGMRSQPDAHVTSNEKSAHSTNTEPPLGISDQPVFETDSRSATAPDRSTEVPLQLPPNTP
jgi:hypothetical protein